MEKEMKMTEKKSRRRRKGRTERKGEEEKGDAMQSWHLN